MLASQSEKALAKTAFKWLQTFKDISNLIVESSSLSVAVIFKKFPAYCQLYYSSFVQKTRYVSH